MITSFESLKTTINGVKAYVDRIVSAAADRTDRAIDASIDRTNNIISEAIAATIDGIPAPSWDNLENKPFYYEELSPNLVLAETQVSAGAGGPGYVGCTIGEYALIPLEFGRDYLVVLDGTEYVLELKQGKYGVYLGNGSIVEDGTEDSDVPFSLHCTSYQWGWLFGDLAVKTELGNDHTIAIYDGPFSRTTKISGRLVEGMGYVETSLSEKDKLFYYFDTRTEGDVYTDNNGSIRYVGLYEFGLDTDLLFEPGDCVIMGNDGIYYEAVAYDTGVDAMNTHIIQVDFPIGSIKTYNENGGGRFDCVGFAPNTRLEFSLSKAKATEIVHPIDPKFLPNDEFVVTFTVDSDNGEAVTCDKSFDEIVNAYNSGCKMMGYMIREGVKSNLPSIRCSFDSETRQWCDFSGFVVWSDPAVWFYSILYNREGGQEEMVYSNITYPEGVD